jgi:hypothetical protein
MKWSGLTVLMLWLLSVGCSTPGGDGPACLDPLPLDCAPLYEPTFDNIFGQTFTGCSVGGSSCHSEQGAKGGLILSDKATAYSLLVDPPNTAPRVLPGDPECSLLIQKLEASSPTVVMPPGNPLVASERCAIIQWVRQGANP